MMVTGRGSRSTRGRRAKPKDTRAAPRTRHGGETRVDHKPHSRLTPLCRALQNLFREGLLAVRNDEAFGRIGRERVLRQLQSTKPDPFCPLLPRCRGEPRASRVQVRFLVHMPRSWGTPTDHRKLAKASPACWLPPRSRRRHPYLQPVYGAVSTFGGVRLPLRPTNLPVYASSMPFHPAEWLPLRPS